MSTFHALNISASGLTAQRLRMDVASSNIANMDTTRAERVNGEWQPYRRKMVAMEPINGSFDSFLQKAKKNQSNPGNGVTVSQIVEDPSPFKLVYQPNHPDANEQGYVELPNVNLLKETVDMISATRSYEANVTALNGSKGMLMKALQIGR